jgi:small subunit ribosomal protein S6
MPLYECVFIARNDVTQQQVETIAEQMATVIGEQSGEVKKREYWGLRGLAYRIKKNRKGHYMLLGVEAPPAAMQEVERQLRLNEDVLRSLTIRVEAIEEGPSAILAKRSDDRDRDRGFRGPRPSGRFGSGRGGGRERGDDREEFRARPRDEIDHGGEE